jgi:PD-(D/E)XK endonuclease
MLTTDQKGAIAETAIAHAAAKLGIEVYRPIAEGRRFDMIFLLGEELVRVQCKWAPRIGDGILVRSYSNRRTREGLRRRVYTADEIDALAACCPDNNSCYYVPFDSFRARTQIDLRLVATQNNQRLGIHWAKDFEFAATLAQPQGAVAQLGERVAGSH